MLTIIEKNGKCGVKNSDTNHFIIPTEYDEIKRNNSIGFIVKKDHLFGVLKIDGSLLIPIKYDNIDTESFTKLTFFKVKKNSYAGIISLNGTIIVPVEYKQATYFDSQYGGVFIVHKNDKKGAYHENSNIIFEVEYDEIIRDEDTGFFKAKKDNQFGISQGDKIIIPVEYDEIKINNDEKHILAIKDQQYVRYNFQGERITDWQPKKPHLNNYF